MPPPNASRPRVLDVACGPNKRMGAVGFDLFPVPGIDLVANFDGPHLPFRDDSFDEVYASHVVEHAGSVVSFLSEIHRVARPGALVHIVTPHYSGHGSWSDPTHRWHLNTRKFWEEYLAFVIRAKDMYAVLEVVKTGRSP
jgi:ubiquinone/menaquinone biosynthesis C-methylase UbiE